MFSKYLETSVLAFIQGLFEFIPVSSSAHLILISKIKNFQIASLQLDICLHLGSLIAIIFYFRKDLINILKIKSLFFLLFFGSVPLILIGFIFHYTGLIDNLRSITVVAWTSLIFGIILYIADKKEVKKKIDLDLNLKNIVIIGVFQVLAIIPGVSRSGIIITASRFLNFDRIDSAKIAFYLSIPALAGASVLGISDLLNEEVTFDIIFLLSIILSFVFSYITIKYFLMFVRNFSLNLFVYYRIFLSIILFIFIYF
tara:strand:- start:795 stop:1562 length:768 start_codon:yes stop_codon:yes gene_type:complete